MSGFGFAPQMQQPQAMPMAPQQAQDPQSQYLAQAIAAMGKQPQGNATGLSSNLLAEALMKYKMGQMQGQFTPGGMGSDIGGAANDAGAMY